MLQYNLTTKDGLMDAKKVLAPIGIGIGVALLLIKKIYLVLIRITQRNKPKVRENY